MASADTPQLTMIDAVNRRDFATIRNLLHDEYVYRTSDGKEQRGPDAGVGVAQMYTSAFPDVKLEVLKALTVGDTNITEFRVRGTHKGDLMGIAPTGKAIDVYVCNVCEIRDGRIYREREYFDSMALMVQLGVVPAPGA